MDYKKIYPHPSPVASAGGYSVVDYSFIVGAHIVCGGLCWLLVCSVVLCALSRLAIILLRKRELSCVMAVCVPSSRFHGMPLGFMGWSMVCDCGIFWSYSLTL